MEKWKRIKEFPDYSVSNYGKVFSHKKGSNRVLIGGKNVQGYNVVLLTQNGVSKGRMVHRLVAQAFIPNPENKPQVNHKDADKDNNHVNNLEWSGFLAFDENRNSVGFNEVADYITKLEDFISEVSKDTYEANPWTFVKSGIAVRAENFIRINKIKL